MQKASNIKVFTSYQVSQNQNLIRVDMAVAYKLIDNSVHRDI